MSLKKIGDGIKNLLKLNPPAPIITDVKIQIGTQGDKLIIKMDRPVDTLTLDQKQAMEFFIGFSSRMQLLKKITKK